MKNAGQKLLDQLLTEDLSGVTFVRDYLQLQFNPPPMINVYSECRVHSGADSASFGEQGFANLVIGQINKAVRSVSDDHEVLTITFADDSRIEIPFGQGTFDGPEAFEFWGRDEHWGVWPDRTRSPTRHWSGLRPAGLVGYLAQPSSGPKPLSLKR